jgi:hypothetical protein
VEDFFSGRPHQSAMNNFFLQGRGRMWNVGQASVLTSTRSGKTIRHENGNGPCGRIAPITNQPFVVALIENKSDGTWFRIACQRGKAGMAIWTRNHRYVYGDRVAVVYRIDDQDPLINEWGTDIGSGVALSYLSRSAYSKFANAKTIAIQLFFKSTQREESIVTIFKAVKTAEALRPVLAACPIENAQERTMARPYHPNEPNFQDGRICSAMERDQ